MKIRSQKVSLVGMTVDAPGNEQLFAAYAQFCDGKRPRIESLLNTYKSQRELSTAIDSLAKAIIDSSPRGTRRWAEDGMSMQLVGGEGADILMFPKYWWQVQIQAKLHHFLLAHNCSRRGRSMNSSCDL